MANQYERRQLLGMLGGSMTVAITAGCLDSAGDDDTGDSADTGDGTETDDESDADEDAWNVGVLLPYTGTYDWVGTEIFPVVDMVAEQINDQGGIAGREINLIQADTEATVDQGITATEKLINVDEVRAVIGPTSLTYTGTLDMFQDNEVASVSPPGSTTELDEQGGDYQFRTVPSDALGGRAIARAAREEDINGLQSYDRMAVMNGQAPALQAFKEPVENAFEEFGGTIVENMDFAVEQSSYDAEVSQVLNSDPEIITLVGTPEDSERILNAAFQAGYEGNWFFTQDQTNESFINSVDEQLTQDAFGLKDSVNPDSIEEGRVEAFADDYREFSGNDPGFVAENTYDAAMVTFLAMTRAVMDDDEMPQDLVAASIRDIANPPGEVVRSYEEAAPLLDDGEDIQYEGLSGPIEFDEYGNVLAPFEILQGQDGAWESVGRVESDELE